MRLQGNGSERFSVQSTRTEYWRGTVTRRCRFTVTYAARRQRLTGRLYPPYVGASPVFRGEFRMGESSDSASYGKHPVHRGYPLSFA